MMQMQIHMQMCERIKQEQQKILNTKKRKININHKTFRQIIISF